MSSHGLNDGLESAPSDHSTGGSFVPLSPATSRGFWFAAVNILIALAVFGLVCAGLGKVLPAPFLTTVTPKMAYFLAHKDDVDVLFLGSSRICHGIVPTRFDEAMKQRGLPCRSFNLAVGHLFPPATFQMIHTVLAARPARLKWIFLELAPIDVNDLEPTLRSVAWHDAAATKLILQSLLTKGTISTAGPALWQNGKLFLVHFTNIGRVPTLLHPAEDDTKRATELAGYMPRFGTVLNTPERKQAYAADLAAMKPAKAGDRAFRVDAQVFREELKMIKRQGIEVILLIPPLPATFGDFLGNKTAHTLYAFNDQHRYSELYDLANRNDRGHLNDQGAQIFTDLVADLFAKRQLSAPQPAAAP